LALSIVGQENWINIDHVRVHVHSGYTKELSIKRKMIQKKKLREYILNCITLGFELEDFILKLPAMISHSNKLIHDALLNEKMVSRYFLKCIYAPLLT